MDYGISNKKGRPNLETSFKILDEAYSNGIRILDTAEAYGDSHKVIELFHSQVDYRFNIISKYSLSIKKYPLKLEKRIEEHCSRFDVRALEGYMFHSHADFKETLQKDKFILEKLKKNNFVKKIGVSVYDNSQIEDILNYQEIDLIQLPFNLLDNENLRKVTLLKAKAKGLEIHTRSVFLQGLYFMDTNKLKGNLIGLKENLDFLAKIARENNSTIMDLALNYPISKNYIDKMLIGVDNVDQLIKNLNSLKEFNKWSVLQEIEAKMNIINQVLLNPSKWTN